MKKYFFPVALFSMALLLAGGLNAQIDQMARDCQAEMETPFITSNKTLKAFLTGEEVAEFRTTLFDGNIYRVVLCTPEAQAVAFSLYDTKIGRASCREGVLFVVVGGSEIVVVMLPCL